MRPMLRTHRVRSHYRGNPTGTGSTRAAKRRILRPVDFDSRVDIVASVPGKPAILKDETLSENDQGSICSAPILSDINFHE